MICPRRPFYPSLSSLDYAREQYTPIADALTRQVLRLPFYHTLSFKEVEIIARYILQVQRYG
jgi:dTDP-4-amino-4,6-dideoxygalactose transaminase